MEIRPRSFLMQIWLRPGTLFINHVASLETIEAQFGSDWMWGVIGQ